MYSSTRKTRMASGRRSCRPAAARCIVDCSLWTSDTVHPFVSSTSHRRTYAISYLHYTPSRSTTFAHPTSSPSCTVHTQTKPNYEHRVLVTNAQDPRMWRDHRVQVVHVRNTRVPSRDRAVLSIPDRRRPSGVDRQLWNNARRSYPVLS
jgi:hypothetical protein